MKINYTVLFGLGLLLNVFHVGCKPKTVGQKIEDKVEDAQHEVNQGMERAGERVEDATEKKN